jgi:hypothetical protein
MLINYHLLVPHMMNFHWIVVTSGDSRAGMGQPQKIWHSNRTRSFWNTDSDVHEALKVTKFNFVLSGDLSHVRPIYLLFDFMTAPEKLLYSLVQNIIFGFVICYRLKHTLLSYRIFNVQISLMYEFIHTLCIQHKTQDCTTLLVK